MLYAYENAIEEVPSELSRCPITQLHLSYNNIRSITWAATLPNLQKLLIAGNQLTNLHGLRGLRHLEEIDASSQRGATPLQITPDMFADVAGTLRVLRIADNGMEDFNALGMCWALEEVDVSGNIVEEPEQLEPLLTGAARLRILDARRTPLIDAESAPARAKARDALIIRSSRALATLNDEPVMPTHRQFLLARAARRAEARQPHMEHMDMPRQNRARGHGAFGAVRGSAVHSGELMGGGYHSQRTTPRAHAQPGRHQSDFHGMHSGSEARGIPRGPYVEVRGGRPVTVDAWGLDARARAAGPYDVPRQGYKPRRGADQQPALAPAVRVPRPGADTDSVAEDMANMMAEAAILTKGSIGPD